MKRTAPIFALVAMFAFAVAAAADVGIFSGEAAVEIGLDGVIAAKIKARNEALKQAVLKAVTQAVPPKLYQSGQIAIEKKILRKAGNYVQSYEIIKAGVEEGYYNILLEARINLDRLTKDVRKLGGASVESDAKKERILLVTTARWQETENPWPALHDPLGARLEMMNLFLVPEPMIARYLDSLAFQRYQEKSYDETYDLAREYDARYALIVRSIIVSREGAGCPSLATARLLDLSNRKVLVEMPYNFKEDVGCEQAALIGAKTIFALLAEKLEGKGIFDSAPVVATRLVLIGVKSFRDTAKIAAGLRSIPDIKSIAMHSFTTGGRVVFRITYEGSTKDLVEAIKRLKPVGFSLARRLADDDSILFEVKY